MSEQAPATRLPKWVDPRKLVNTEASFKRKIDPADLPRLSEAVEGIDIVDVDIVFDRDQQGRPQLTGQLSAKLVLECQRCLDEMPFLVEKPLLLKIVWDEAQAKALPRDVDPWIVDSDEADVCSILEEEILLMLPVVAKHEHECLSPEMFQSGDALEVSDDKPNPFAILADIKDDLGRA